MKVPLPQVEYGKVLADGVAACLRKAILNGFFEPNEKLDQRRIAEELEVSRTPVREALRRLESEGFIDVRPHRGAFIPRISRRAIREIYEVRQILESEVVRLATPLIPKSVLEELGRRLIETQAKFETGDFTDHFAVSIDFHDAILASIENTVLKEVLDSLNNRIRMIRRFAQLQPGSHLIDALREHRVILEAMQRGAAEEAAELMRLHMEKSGVRLQQLVKQKNATLIGSGEG